MAEEALATGADAAELEGPARDECDHELAGAVTAEEPDDEFPVGVAAAAELAVGGGPAHAELAGALRH